MSAYKSFAAVYDRLMKKDLNYHQLLDFIENCFIRYDKNPDLVVDLACGTGNITLPMAHRGYNMTGVDKSYEMLSIARKKVIDEDILFLRQSLTQLDLFGSADAFLCMTDGINYILTPSALFELFQKIRTCFMNPGGIFIFDISSEHKLSTVIGNNTFIHDGDDLFYTWQNRYYPNKRLSDMCLNFFVHGENGYERFFERHLQHAYTKQEIISMLEHSGFTKVECFGGMDFSEPTEESERLYFVALA